MRNTSRVTIGLRQTFRELEKQSQLAREQLRLLLTDLGQAEMVDKIIELDLSGESLNFLSKGIVLDNDDDKICNAVEIIKNAEHNY